MITDITSGIYVALKQTNTKNPGISIHFIINIALDYISNLKEDSLKLITNYYGRKHTPHTSM